MRVALAIAVVVIAFVPRRRPVPRFRANDPTSPTTAALDGLWLGVGVLFMAGLTSGVPLLVVVAPVIGVASHRERARRDRRASERHRNGAMVDFVDRMAEGLRAGTSITNAVVTAIEPVADRDRRRSHPCLAQLSSSVAAGRPIAVALDAALDEPGISTQERFVFAAVAALLGSGGAALSATERLGDALRERAALHDALRTQAQQAISSALVMTALPVVFSLVAGLVDRSVARFLQSTWTGAACVGLSLVLTAIGWEWQQRLIANVR